MGRSTVILVDLSSKAVSIAVCSLKIIYFYKIILAVHHSLVPFNRIDLIIRTVCVVYTCTRPLVYDENLK